ncbi:hypothetical protein [Leisingera methylohalidivorans]|uniref:Uncharacterized protein n=1 Tax=Leisingera methylohalidivorans DSM 14336 TaxID=999552 RepID=V9VWN5_9RHOB|nr:hypothetical protein [Leisingera methylohalidivorans]AHD03181.1 hypothetical protein METH_15905 [Leisingera methylohalidivorans DSM 14336]
MPLPFLAIAIPVIHSSGAWIASTGAAGYIAGTLSSTWIGAFVLGNSTLLGSLGLVSAAGIFGATGGLAAFSSSAALGVGSALTAVGLGGVASTLGIAPAATFLGLTPVGWAAAGTAATLVATLGYFFTRKTMRRLNEEREKGGLEPITLAQIVKEVRLLEAQSLETILARLDTELNNVSLSSDHKEVSVDGQLFSLNRLKYVVNKDGSEEVVFVTRTGRKKRVLLVRAAPGPDGHPA